LPDALDLANRCGGPHQNFVVGDATGQIAWTVLGRIPRRIGYEGRFPMDWSDGTCRWDGYLKPEEYPRIMQPSSGRLWTANARVVAGDNLKKIGQGGYDRGARAGQIRDGLLGLNKATEADMLQIHLDDRALFLQRWQKFLLEKVLPSDHPFRPHVENWGGRASVDSVGFRIVKEYREMILNQILQALTAPCRKADRRFALTSVSQPEDTVWRIINQQPPYLLPPGVSDWPSFLRNPLHPLMEKLHREGSLEQATWGKANRLRMRHPISRGAEFLANWLDMPAVPMAGAPHDMPRIQAPTFGASERFAVSPGREELGYFHMPGGQSGHPLSPHYRDSHRAWAEGQPTSFLPGPTVHVLTLVSKERNH
jgi:penicillin amidase